MKKLFILITIGLFLWSVSEKLTTIPNAQEATPTIWLATSTGVVDSIRMGGYNRIMFICNLAQMTAVTLKVEGARDFGIGEWGNLDSNNNTLTVTPSASVDSTFVMVFEGYMPCFRINVTAMSGTAESLFIKTIRYNEGDL